jgi:hypothetical protein
MQTKYRCGHVHAFVYCNLDIIRYNENHSLLLEIEKCLLQFSSYNRSPLTMGATFLPILHMGKSYCIGPHILLCLKFLATNSMKINNYVNGFQPL